VSMASRGDRQGGEHQGPLWNPNPGVRRPRPSL
jgi:hypothetical protein